VTETVVASATREVVLGFDRPFVLIGERINPTGRKRLAEEMVSGDFSTVVADAVAQVEAGAHMLDVNAGIPLADEPGMLAEAIRLVQSVTDVPLCIDSSIVDALEAGLAAYRGKALVNSVTGEEERLERVLPLVAKHGAAVVAITNDETGISEDPDVRFEVARRIVERAADHGIPRDDVVVDPLLMPIGAMGTAGRQVFRILGRLRDELKVNSTCGASNVAFGLPNRPALSATFIAMASATGLTSAITNPLHEAVRTAVAASDVLRGADRDCVAWIGRFREGPSPGAEGRRRGGREGRRRGTAAGGDAAGGSAAGAVDTPDAGGGAAGAAGEP
jgi:5-methyltetrahydrofolate--homocysteine methyltransferase